MPLRSPLSDVPTFKARSASQLEATINAALGPHPYETAWLTLNALRPMTYSDGFSAVVDLSALDKPSADRIRMVLTAGADIGAVETMSLNPERYRVRSELREYLSSVCDRHFKRNSSAKEKARLHQLVGAALEPYPREHADIVLHTLEPIREIEGFTSKVALSAITDVEDTRLVRRVMNAGATVKAVAPDKSIADLFYVSPVLYETLLTIRATAPENPRFAYERQARLSNERGPALDAGRMRDARTPIAEAPAQPQLSKPDLKVPPAANKAADEAHDMKLDYIAQLIEALDVDSRGYLQMDAATRGAAARACEVFKRLRETNEALEVNLLRADEIAHRQVDEAHSTLTLTIKPSDTLRRAAVEAAAKTIDDDWQVLMLLPRGPYERALEALIEPLEEANGDGRLGADDQHLLRALRRLRQPLYASRRDSEADWTRMELALKKSYAEDMPRIARGGSGHTLN